MSAGLVVGFDLDMTLIDSRPGIGAVLTELAAQTGTPIDVDLVLTRLGPRLEDELANWFPAAQVPEMADRFRAIYPERAITGTSALPGALDSLRAVRQLGGRSVIVTAKHPSSARLHLDHLDLDADALEGWRWGSGKTDALREHRAMVYVGDHAADMAAAVAAGAVPVGVATGGTTRTELEEAGADVVLDSLLEFPDWLHETVLARRLGALEEWLRTHDSVLVALSGGADSAFLLAAAVRALGPMHVVAATAVSDSLAAGELDLAADLAADLGVRHLTPRTFEAARAGYRANGPDRCYHCRAELIDALQALARPLAITTVLIGSTLDPEAVDPQPPARAAEERGARAPLQEVGLTKEQVREASRRWDLVTWDKPPTSCLASRIAPGVEVTTDRLARVDRAEAALRRALAEDGLAATDVRVHDLGVRDGAQTASITVGAPVVDAVRTSQRALEAVRLAGFDAVELTPCDDQGRSIGEALGSVARLG